MGGGWRLDEEGDHLLYLGIYIEVCFDFWDAIV